MPSLYEELIAKLARDPRLTRRGGPRFDLSLLLFNAREAIAALWQSAHDYTATGDPAARARLLAAIEALRPIFGPR